MKKATRYEATVEALQAAHAELAEAQKTFEEAKNVFAEAEHKTTEVTTAATSYYADKLAWQRGIIRTVVEKHNRGRRWDDHISPAGYKWATGSHSIEIVSLQPATFTIRLVPRGAKPGDKLEEVMLSTDLFSQSNWAMAAAVRKHLWKLRAQKLEEKKQAIVAKLSEERKKVARSIEAEEQKLKKLREEQERLERREAYFAEV